MESWSADLGSPLAAAECALNKSRAQGFGVLAFGNSPGKSVEIEDTAAQPLLKDRTVQWEFAAALPWNDLSSPKFHTPVQITAQAVPNFGEPWHDSSPEP